MDVSTCSYNTLIIHTDDSLYSSMLAAAAAAGGTNVVNSHGMDKKDMPIAYDEQGMQEITEIPDDYLNQSHVLKHLAKEIKIPNGSRRRTSSRESSTLNSDAKDPPKYEQWVIDEQNEQTNNKMKSKSQPDLTKWVQSASFGCVRPIAINAKPSHSLQIKWSRHGCNGFAGQRESIAQATTAELFFESGENAKGKLVIVKLQQQSI